MMKLMVGRRLKLFGFFLPVLPVLICALSGNAAAQNKILTANVHSCTPAPEPFVTERLAFWQKRLNVSDWKISIIMSHPSDLKPDTLGNIHWDADRKSAVIRVLAASDYQLACSAMLDDMEFTVVHELLHLVLSTLPHSQASRRKEEVAVNQIADALLALDRRER